MMNCRAPAKLPLHIEKFMNDSGDDGVILVSFGTVLQASQMSESLRLKLISVLGNMKQRVLMKWENEEEMMAADQFPANMMLSKWLPQQDILAHPKLRLFITHGGQSSSQEALCHKKPVVKKNSTYFCAKNSYQNVFRSLFPFLAINPPMALKLKAEATASPFLYPN